MAPITRFTARTGPGQARQSANTSQLSDKLLLNFPLRSIAIVDFDAIERSGYLRGRRL